MTDGWTQEELIDIGERLKRELANVRYTPPEPTAKEKRILQVAEILNIRKGEKS